MACESAVILARLLADHPPSDELFQRYVTLRRPRTDRVTINARRGINNMLTWELIRNTAIYLLGNLFLRIVVIGHIHYDAGTVPLD
jgi:2-polyprenyl-6-methoxyphenol hydroxylase-like FAD-dependent oxidoreductase